MTMSDMHSFLRFHYGQTIFEEYEHFPMYKCSLSLVFMFFLCQSDSTLRYGKNKQDPRVVVTIFSVNADNAVTSMVTHIMAP